MTVKQPNHSILNLNRLILLQIIVFIVIRIFVGSGTLFIQWDESKYLTLARNFPLHKLYNHSFYLAHPPLLPYFIKSLSLFLPDYFAGIILSFLSTCAFMAFFYMLLGLIGLRKREIFFCICFITYNWITYYYSHMIFKEAFYLFTATGTIYLFVSGISNRSTVRLILAGLFGCASAFTSDLAMLLPPILLTAYVVYTKKGDRNANQILPILICTLACLGWILIKYRVFASNNYYPAGLDGTIENLGDTNSLRQIIFPWFLPNTQRILNFGGFSTSILHYINEIGVLVNLIWPFHISQSLQKTHKTLLLLVCYAPLFTALAVGLICSLVDAIRRKSFTGNHELFMLIFLFVSLIPLTNKMGAARYAIVSVIPICYFVARGAGYAASRIKLSIPNSIIMIFIIIELIVFVPLWMSRNRFLIFNLKKEVQCEKTGEFLSHLEGDGIMAELGYPPEIVYLTGKRVMCLPREAEKLDRFIRLFDIKYLVCATTYDGKEENGESHIANYIAKSNKYVKIKTIYEMYSSVPWGNKVTIYEVPSNIQE